MFDPQALLLFVAAGLVLNFRRKSGAITWIQRGSGALLAGLGLHLALHGRPA